MANVTTQLQGLKFGRNYSLSVETGFGNTVTIAPPFTLELDITRNTMAGANVCHLRIYNLGVFTRESLAFNAFNQTEFRSLQLQAGYGSQLSTIFYGNVTQCWSVREKVNFITEIECYDGGFAIINAPTNWAGASFDAGTPMQVVIETLMNALPNVTIGAIGDFSSLPPLLKYTTYSGNPAKILFDITGGAFFIDNSKAFCLAPDEYVVAESEGSAILISDATGLLNTPVREQSLIRFEMLFEPTLNIGSLADVQSKTFPAVNGQYKITAIKHRGIISSTVCGNLVTFAEMNASKSNVPVSPL